jgi:hypothetical protein
VIRLKFFFVGVIVAGVMMILVALRPLVTGQNYSGALGRGFTKSDDLRMRRAPAVWFRALGALGAAIGLLAALFGAVIVFGDRLPVTVLLVGVIVIPVGVVGILAWLLVLARRYRLFRWDPP